jgi:hypothetical protein
LAWLGLLAAVGCAHHEVRADDMSAEAHRRAAADERARADDEAARYDPTVTAAPPASLGREGPVLFPLAVYAPFNPTLRHIYRADEMAAHAAQHERAAAELEAFEDQECGAFPPTTRAACPVLGPVRVEDLPDGVRLHLPATMPVDATLAHMRCHLAYARTRGFAPTATCPLYLRGTQIRRAPEGDAVDLVSDEPRTARLLQRLARGSDRDHD